MKIMPIRLQVLNQAYQAIWTTGQALIRELSNGLLIPAEYQFGGDIGCTYAITSLSKLFYLDLLSSIFLFYGFFLITSSLVAWFGINCFTKSYKIRFLSFLSILFLALLSWRIGDEYIMSFCAVAYMPLLFYFFEKKDKKLLLIISFVIGVLVALFNFFRIHTGTLLAIVFCARITMSVFLNKNKFLFLILLCCGYCTMQYLIRSLFIERNHYLSSCGYNVTSEGHIHTFWHNLYPGFGFIENDKNLYFSDQCSVDTVKAIDSSAVYLSKQYNDILKHQVFNLIINNPHFVLRVFFAKLGVVFYYLILCLLPSFWALFLPYMPLRIHICYWIAMLWGALPGLLTIPNILYVLGFVASAWLYGLHLMVYALNVKSFYFYMGNIKNFFVKLFRKVRLMEF